MRDFHLPGRSPVFAENGMCATSHPLAVKVALDILAGGGNAMDAAIGAAVLQGICEPAMTGLGGDCFVLFQPGPGQELKALNGSGRAPAALTAQALRDKGFSDVPPYSAHAVTVPGAVDAFCKLSSDWGRLELSRVLAPAIHYAETGVPVAPRVAWDWRENADVLQGEARRHYLINDKPLDTGQVFRAPGQAEVLRRIAKDGRKAFYEGEVAEDMVNSLNALGGVHTLEDFAATACNETTPISGDYKSLTLSEHPPNGHGATAILLTNILSQFDLPSMDPFGAERAHIEAEAVKLAYDARDRFIADADYMTRLDHMLAPETARDLAALIDPNRAMEDTRRITEQVHRETITISVVDRDRMAVSLIYSIFKSFGSGLASTKFGINFHNRGAGFCLEAGHPNEAGGGKRPLHTILPGFLHRKGKFTMPFGVMGGAYQPNGHARFLTNIEDFNLHPQAAIDAPRAFADQGILKVERGYSDAVRAELADKGHKVVIPDEPIGGAQSVMIDLETGVLQGASDPRKDGCALGY